MRSLALMLLAALPLAHPPVAQAQEADAPAATIPTLPPARPAAGPQRQGPELDVFRDPPPGQAPSPAPGQAPGSQTPVVQIPPPVVAPPVATQPPAATRAEPARPPAGRETPTTRRSSPDPAEPPATTPPAAVIDAPRAPAAEPAPQRDVTRAPAPPVTPPPAPPAETSAQTDSAPWPWIGGGLVLLLLMLAVAAALRRRRAGTTLSLPAPLEPTEPDAAPTPEPESAPRPVARPAPAPPPTSTPAPPIAPVLSAERPHLAMTLEVSGARLSLMGATITYGLTVTNAGQKEARDILVRAVIANASAPMDDLLKPFFAGDTGLAVHSVPSLAPGETVHLKSELRLDPDRIAPINAGARALLIPLLAFDARYGWAEEAGEALGRTGRAFIVGQEQEPPTERLSPFRLDLGPRQFRRPAARATALALDA